MSKDAFISLVEDDITKNHPHLLKLFRIYADEAIFWRFHLSSDVDALGQGSRLLEVGAGSLLLSCQLKAEGFDVTSLDPIGGGFTHFDALRQLVLKAARENNCVPTLIADPAESLQIETFFDYAFSTNVMEHVSDYGEVLRRVVMSLRVSGTYRFTCPNYLFPYEPHFNIPTLFSKALTEKIFKRFIDQSTKVVDPVGTWLSLNWITVPKIREAMDRIPQGSISFQKELTVKMMRRLISDTSFADRKAGLIRTLAVVFLRLSGHKLVRLMPATFLPTIDCRIVRNY